MTGTTENFPLWLACLHPALLQADCYKTGHRLQYPEGTELVYSNMTARNFKHVLAKVNPAQWDELIPANIGLSAFIKEVLIGQFNVTFFHRPWNEVHDEYFEVVSTVLDQPAFDMSHIQALYTLGYLPIEIRALEEGSLIGANLPAFTVNNTLPEFAWLTNKLETLISSDTWKVVTVAAIARNFRRTTEAAYAKDGSPSWMLPYAVHDFSARGMSGHADAASSGVGHLTAFAGTDTLGAVHRAKMLYDADLRSQIVGKSVNATEHSVMCIMGEEGEFGVFDRLITNNPTGILSMVSDGFNLWNVLTQHMPKLRDKIMARQGRIVIRPDSGNPADIICGTAYGVENRFDMAELSSAWVKSDRASKFVVFEKASDSYYLVDYNYGAAAEDDMPMAHVQLMGDEEVMPEHKGAYRLLYETFGGALNESGYIDLDTHVGLIYGDSIDPKLYQEIIDRLHSTGFSISNLVVGVGSYCYQFLTRDSLGSAIKATFAVIDGEPRSVVKNPVTGDGTKKSAHGLLRVVADAGGKLYLIEGGTATLDEILAGNYDSGLLQPLFRDGKLLQRTTLHDTRIKLYGWDDTNPNSAG